MALKLHSRVFASFGFLLLSACRGGPDIGVKIHIHQDSLSNGLRILLIEDHSAPVISYQTWVRAGSVDERPGASGLAHLFEHLMFKGTEAHGPGTFFKEFDAKGALVNAFTTRDYTVFYEVIPPELLPKAIELEADRLRNLKLDQKLLDSERLVVLEERRLRVENSPEGKLQEALWELAYREHPYGKPVIGSMEDLLSIRLENLSNFYNTYYQPANVTLVITGDIQRKETLTLIRKFYGPLPKTPRPGRSPRPEPEQTGERRLILRDKVASERFAQAYHIPPAGEDDAYALDVLSNILFAGRNSRAYRRLVEEKQLLLNVSGTAFTPTYPGLFIISGVVRGEGKTEPIEKEFETILQELATISEEEVRTATRQLLVQYLDNIRTQQGLGQLVGTVDMILGDPDLFASEAERYARVKPLDVVRVAARYLQPNNRAVVIMRKTR